MGKGGRGGGRAHEGANESPRSRCVVVEVGGENALEGESGDAELERDRCR